MYGIAEDAWDNYLYHDAKHVISLLCHSKSLPISEQIILSKFINQSIQDETVSQFVINNSTAFITDLIAFAKQFDMGEVDNEIIDSEEDEE
jgi:hypothetical protein